VRRERRAGPTLPLLATGIRPQTIGVIITQTDAHNTDRDERRALLEQRRATVAHQLRCLAIELTDLDRQLDDIEQSDG